MEHALVRDIRMGDLIAPLMASNGAGVSGAAGGDPQARAAK
jgi:hypothetical protein